MTRCDEARFLDVLHIGGQVAATLEVGRSCCAYYTGDLCGGCDECLLRQAAYNNMRTVPHGECFMPLEASRSCT